MAKIILDLCGGTGSWGKPYRNAGYDTRLITLPEYDVRTYCPPEDVYGILAAPPCESFSIAPRKEYRKVPIEHGLSILNACLQIIKKCNPVFYAIENPCGLMRRYMGKPRFTFQPYWFGDGWTKKQISGASLIFRFLPTHGIIAQN
jgi:site-specific DNA-cytosine methylase